ncbi:MAG TPA: co-chaperone DjlA [Steroidobacteraceae bacterium]|nr:co-chaperone DjlA [Steroidobacteraceae bacterium]
MQQRSPPVKESMGWYGKLIGAVLGWIIGRGLFGAIVGLVIGHQFDRRARAVGSATGSAPSEFTSAFFRATFQVMGHVAKADGRVTEQEIEAARAVMRHYSLGPAETRLAIELFTAGKRADFPLESVLRELRVAAAGRGDLMRVFVQIQLEAAMHGDGLNPASRAVFARICGALGVSAAEFAALEAMLRMSRGFDGAGPGPSQSAGTSPARLDDAYQVLGVRREASDREVKLAYRRLMSQNHPDKLVANGLPASMIEAAHERTRRILAAYEAVRESRGMK